MESSPRKTMRSGTVRQGREKARKKFMDEGLTPVGTWFSVLLETL